MRLLLMHVDDFDRSDPSWPEEAAFLVPGGQRVVTMMPFHALDKAVPILAKALQELPDQVCDACGKSIAAMPDRPFPL
jgi:hypothetical protein